MSSSPLDRARDVSSSEALVDISVVHGAPVGDSWIWYPRPFFVSVSRAIVMCSAAFFEWAGQIQSSETNMYWLMFPIYL